MPYITRERREQIDPSLKMLPGVATAGDLNYVLTRTVQKFLSDKGRAGGPTYADINEVVGVIECMKLELYRRLAAPYEDLKAKLNGDVYR